MYKKTIKNFLLTEVRLISSSNVKCNVCMRDIIDNSYRHGTSVLFLQRDAGSKKILFINGAQTEVRLQCSLYTVV